MNYSEALEYIHSISWSFCKPGLERIRELCERLGNPQKSLKFIHVAGTNGKGSFSAMTESILRASGYKTGLFTSPYIVSFNERMKVCGKDISERELCEITEYVKPHADAMSDKPTEFELITAIGFEYFKRNNTDIVILEAGMGGRLDSTNIIDTAVLSVITGIALDHTAFLGDTVEKIAKEKAGIIKHGVPVLYGGDDAVAADVIRGVANDREAEFYQVDKSGLKILSTSVDGTLFDYNEYQNLSLSLLGTYQPKNAANVLNALNILKNQGYKVNEEAVRKGLSEVRWPARFEIISREPLIIFDGAHNPEGIEAAVQSVKEYFKNERVYILSGVLRDKDYVAVAKKLSEIAKTVFTVTPSSDRALKSEEYRDTVLSMNTDAIAFNSVSEAVTHAYRAARDTNTPLICLGSLYTYCEIKPLIDVLNS